MMRLLQELADTFAEWRARVLQGRARRALARRDTWRWRIGTRWWWKPQSMVWSAVGASGLLLAWWAAR